LNKYNFCSLRNPFINEIKNDISNFNLIGYHNNDSRDIDEPNESIIKSQSVLIDFIDIDSESQFEDNLIYDNLKSKIFIYIYKHIFKFK
jgi:hypothetical protein